MHLLWPSTFRRDDLQTRAEREAVIRAETTLPRIPIKGERIRERELSPRGTLPFIIQITIVANEEDLSITVVLREIGIETVSEIESEKEKGKDTEKEIGIETVSEIEMIGRDWGRYPLEALIIGRRTEKEIENVTETQIETETETEKEIERGTETIERNSGQYPLEVLIIGIGTGVEIEIETVREIGIETVSEIEKRNWGRYPLEIVGIGKKREEGNLSTIMTYQERGL
mgnify:CR=1 FL=1